MAEPKQPEAAPAAEPAPEPEAPARNVHEALRRVMRDLPGIGKLSPEQHKARAGTANQQGGERGVTYSYRSIEQITGHTQELFARHGIVLVPQPTPDYDVRDFVMGDRATRWEDVKQPVYYWVLGPGAVTLQRQWLPSGRLDYFYTGDVLLTGPFIGVGRDNADKGHNKAMTMAEKQCLLQLLQIGDPGEDPDHERALEEGSQPGPRSTRQRRQRGGKDPEPPADEPQPLWQRLGYESEAVHASQIGALREASASLSDEHKEQMRAWLVEHGAVFPEDHEKAGQAVLGATTAKDAPALAQLLRAWLAQERKEAGEAEQDASQPPADAADAVAPDPGTGSPEPEPGAEAHTGPDPGQSEDPADGGAPEGPGGSQGPSGRRPRNPR